MSHQAAPDPQLLLRQATSFHQKGMLAEAEQIYLQLMVLQPGNAAPRHMLGTLRLQQRRDDEALALIEDALKIDPGDPFAHAGHGNALKILRRPAEAVASFDRALALKPDFVGGHYNRALLLQEMGQQEEALASYDRVLALQPNFIEAWNNRGMLLQNMQRAREATASLERALAIQPEHADAWNSRGKVLRTMKRYDEALASFDRALALQPDFPNAHSNRGNILLRDLKRVPEALSAFDRAVTLQPDFVEAWNDRGNALYCLERYAEALESYDKALALGPDYAEAWSNRGRVFFEMNRTDEGIAAFSRAAALTYGAEQSPFAQTANSSLPSLPHKLRHDQEQHDYQAGIAGKYSDKPGARLAGPAVTPGNVLAAQDWRTKKPQIAVIDNLLTPEALEGLRRFCREQPIWRKSFAGGYLGAFPDHGFACPLLGQIAEELNLAFPEIFRDLPLRYMWGFKYDSTLSGINIHADEAAVNVNFWLTPDEANLDPQSGGLVVWDVAAPLDWDFDKFNSDISVSAIRDFLARNGAKSVRVPYRANRAVIFDSDLFHETDTIRFQDGYLNRRINVTMLFGQRGQNPAA